MLRIAVFASGSGTNAENLARYFAGSKLGRVHMIFTNNPAAGVIPRAGSLGLPYTIFSKKEFNDEEGLIKVLLREKIDLIVLAGFLLLLPPFLVKKFHRRIVNIHPALLPQHGGKGFYGSNVHQSVIDSGAHISGITIHHINERFDEGEIIFQAACHVSMDDTVDSLAEKIHKLEYAWYPVVIEKFIQMEKSEF